MGERRSILPWLVHLYTALGLVAAAGAVVLVLAGGEAAFRAAFGLLLLAGAIDASDGWLARRTRAAERTPGFDGRRLDDLTDFQTYTTVPLFLIWQAELLPGPLAWWLLVPLLASAYGFSQTRAKTEDGFFLGFPSYWNVLALYLYFMNASPALTLTAVLTLSLLTFVPMKYLYPSLRGPLSRLTIALGAVWVLIIAAVLLDVPAEPRTWLAVSLLFPAFYMIASWTLTLRDLRRRPGGRGWATKGMEAPAILAAAAVVAGCGAVVPEPVAMSAADGPLRTGHGAVASANEISSRVGTEVMRDGGNAVDAAIAVGFALAVTHPTAGNIGGGGFMVIRFPDGESTTFDFREKAPLAAHAEMFLDETGQPSSELRHRSHLSVGVPGTVAGFALAHERYGSLSWDHLVGPAVELASDGFPVMPGLARSLAAVLPSMARYSSSIAAFSRDGEPYEAGEIWRQPDLARTLERIQREGRDGFYRGETARLVAEEMRSGGGLITEEDLARYEAIEREPLRGRFRGHEIIGMGPPSSGGTALIQMLNILEGFDLAAMGHNSPAYLHHLAEAMRLAYRDRARHLADADFVDVPVGMLTSPAYADELRPLIDPARAGVSSPEDLALAPESEETTHYSVVDADGLAVSVTYTLEQGYGSRITVTGGGFLLNNEMGDFNPAPGLTTAGGLIGTEPNIVRPEQRMLSSMTPTILVREGERVAVIGTPGGRTIINTVLQLVLNIVDFGMDLQDAVNAPRIHHQWLPDRITLERELATDEIVAALEAMGHDVAVRGAQGTAHAAALELGTGTRIGAADPRGTDAAAAGY